MSVFRDCRVDMFVQVVVSGACISLGICTSMCVLTWESLVVGVCVMGSAWSMCAGHVYEREYLGLGVYE